MVVSQHILHGPRDDRILPVASMGEYYLARLQAHGNKVAQIQQVDGVEVSVTYSELLRHGKVVAGLLRQHGLGSGDTVMLCCGNTLDVAPIMMGTLFVGAALAPVNPAFDESDILHLLGTIKPQVVIYNALAESALQKAVKRYIVTPSPTLLTVEAVNRRMKEDPDVQDFRLGIVADPDTHVALVMCSSGTSGKPKGVEIAHSRVMHQVTFSIFPEDNAGVSLNLSGPFWVSCQLTTLHAFSRGLMVVLLAPFKEDAYLSAVQKYKVTATILGPDQLVALAKYPSFSAYDVSSLRHILYGGAPMSLAMLRLAESTLRKRITVLYGMTECMGLMPSYDVLNKPCNVGTVATNTSAKVVDIDTGETLGPNRDGELCFKSPSSFIGYRGNRQATADMFDEDGFLHSGDVGHYDQDGYFFIVDRIKELIKFRRDHVPATDIEEVLVKHPDVLDAAVFGVYHETDWEHATAVVVRRPDVGVSQEELAKLVQGNLPEFKWLHGGVYFADSLPRTASGKVQKYVLRQTYAK